MFVYRPSPIRIKPEQTYYIVIQGTECYITNSDGLSNDQFKYFDKPLSTLDFFSRFAGMVTPEFADQYDDLKAKLF